MRPGQASRSAVFTCMGRAIADGRTSVARFSDPTALTFLPPEARERAQHLRAHPKPKSLSERWGRHVTNFFVQMMPARTVFIDDAVRSAGSPQLVILGAGLDGRAWRMRELGDVTVFEVDHPDTQREKRARAAALSPTARDVRFVPVDFTRDDLADALAASGHSATEATTWIWEGIICYLTDAEIAATLSVLRGRSAPGSTLLVTYPEPAPLQLLVQRTLARGGERLLSFFTAPALRQLFQRHGFEVTRDEDLRTLTRQLSADGRAVRRLKHYRIASAVRA